MADYNGDTKGPLNTLLKYVNPETYVPVVSIDNAPGIAAFGEELVSQIMPQTAWRFDYGTNTRFISTTGTFSGYVSGSFSQAELGTSTNVSGSAQITTIKPLRYLPGFGGLCRFTAVFNSGTANSEQIVGLVSTHIMDGFAFGYNGASFGIVSIRQGTRTWIPQALWNGKPLSYIITPQTGNVYQIRFQWLGYGNIYFMIFDKLQRKFVIVHTIEYPNTSVIPSILNPTLKLFARIANLGNNTNLKLLTPSALGALEGHTESSFYNPLNVSNSFDRLVTFADANNNHAISLRNKNLFLGTSNRIPVQLTSITISRSGGAGTAATSTIRLYRNAVTAGALSFVDVDLPNSPCDTSITTTTITSTNAERSYTLSQNTTQLTIFFKPGEFILSPNESLSVGVQNSGVQSTDVAITANWEELF